MECKASGKILSELPSSSGTLKSGKYWEKREYIMETSERYHSKMKFSLCSFDGQIENPPKVGDCIKLYFVVEAKEYQGKWYNDVKGTRLEVV